MEPKAAPLRVDVARVPDHEPIGELFATELCMPRDRVAGYLDLVGTRNVRIVRRADDVLACACLAPMGQYFGERSVRTTGVTAVCAAPELAGSNTTTILLREVLRDLAAQGVGLSTTYGANFALFRQNGYAGAGARYRAQIPANALGLAERGGVLTPMDSTSETRVRALYGAHAPSFSGYLERSDYIWTRLLRPESREASCIVVKSERDFVEGYVCYSKSKGSRAQNGHTVTVHDMFAMSAWGYRRLWSFLADLGPDLGATVEFFTAPQDPARLALPNPTFPVTLTDTWMIRISHVEAALSQRGYPPRLKAELDLDLYDDVVDANNGRWRLMVEGGRGRVERGGSGTLRCDVQGLAALYAGFSCPAALACTDRLSGTPAALAIAGSVFNGPQPWMREKF